MIKTIISMCFIASLSLAAQRVSLETLLNELPAESEITAAYRKPELNAAQIKQWAKSSEPLWNQFKTLVEASQGFVRGEIEQEKVLSSLTAFLQLSVLRCRLEISEARPQACSSIIPTWFRFAGDIAFEESSLVSLRLAPVFRSLWLDEMETWPEKSIVLMASAQDWIWGLPAPWPVDRILLAQGRKLVKASEAKMLEKMALDFQKNNYQSAEQMLKKIPGPKPAEMDFVKKMWRPEDLEAMKTEITRLNRLRVQAAQSRYSEKQKKAATGYPELLGSKLISSIPVDYLTGRPMEWPTSKQR